MQPFLAPPRASRWIWAPFAFVLVLAAAWSAFWVYAARRAETDLEAFLAREAKAGRVYSCAQRSVGGYPFRIEVRCPQPSAELRDGANAVTVRARDLVAIGQIYTPDLVLAEITAPLTVSRAGDPSVLSFDWGLMQASVRAHAGRPERVSITLDAPKLDIGSAESPRPLGQAKHAELHGRLSPGSDPATPVFEVAASVQDAVPASAGASPAPMGAEGTAIVRGLHDLSPKPWPERLRDWQRAGGRMEITRLRFTRGDTVAIATGELGLTADGRLDGTLNITTTGIEPVADLLLGPNEARAQAAILTGLRLIGGRAELEGKRAIALPLRFRDGKAALGPLPLGTLPALF